MLIVLAVALVFFFIHHTLHIQPSFIALTAAAVALVWIQPDLHEMLQLIEWNVLIFFGALFVMVGGLEAAGVLHLLAEGIGNAGNLSPVVFGIITIWVVAALIALLVRAFSFSNIARHGWSTMTLWDFALRTLLADRGKLMTALTGVAFCVVLVNV